MVAPSSIVKKEEGRGPPVAAARAAVAVVAAAAVALPRRNDSAVVARTRSRARSEAAAAITEEVDDDETKPPLPSPYDATTSITTPAKRPRRLSLPSPSPSPAPPKTNSSHNNNNGSGRPGLGPKLGTGLPLRLIILGHNPSDTAWATGHFYGHGSNKMWPLLARIGVTPASMPPGPADDLLPESSGVGFLDVGTGTPGTHSSAFSSRDFERWRPIFYSRIKAHVAAASASVGGCSCGKCGAPFAVAFAGKRQYQELLALRAPVTSEEEEAADKSVADEAKTTPPPTTTTTTTTAKKKKGNKGAYSSSRLPPVELGLQSVLLTSWPLPPTTQVYVTATTSGAAGLTNEAREASWRAMWGLVGREPWPRRVKAVCGGGAAGAAFGGATAGGGEG